MFIRLNSKPLFNRIPILEWSILQYQTRFCKVKLDWNFPRTASHQSIVNRTNSVENHPPSYHVSLDLIADVAFQKKISQKITSRFFRGKTHTHTNFKSAFSTDAETLASECIPSLFHFFFFFTLFAWKVVQSAFYPPQLLFLNKAVVESLRPGW